MVPATPFTILTRSSNILFSDCMSWLPIGASDRDARPLTARAPISPAPSRNSTLPSGPVIGLGRHAETPSSPVQRPRPPPRRRRARGLRGRARRRPCRLRSRPASNCGLISATSFAPGLARSSAASSTLARPMKLASQTMMSIGSGTMSRSGRGHWSARGRRRAGPGAASRPAGWCRHRPRRPLPRRG